MPVNRKAIAGHFAAAGRLLIFKQALENNIPKIRRGGQNGSTATLNIKPIQLKLSRLITV